MVRGGRGFRSNVNRGSTMYVPVEVPAGNYNQLYDFPEAQYMYGGRNVGNAGMPMYGKLAFSRRQFGFGRTRQRGGGYIMYQPAFVGRLRRRQSLVMDRQRGGFRVPASRYKSNQNPTEAPKRPFWRRRPQQSQQRRRPGRRPMNNGRRSNRLATTDALDAQLDEYMGDSVAKTRLDSQLDVYFGRPATHTSAEACEPLHDKAEPMSDPNDISMDVTSQA